MAIIRKGYDNTKTYIGLLSDDEIEKADLLLSELVEKIPKIEEELKKKYGMTLDYKYYLGEHLAKYIQEKRIKERERLYFWREIEEFASKNHNPNSESDQRHFYEYCYLIYSVGYNLAHALTYRQWNDILARKRIRSDTRIFQWFHYKQQNNEKLYWRDFLPVLNGYLLNKDTTVFSDDEIYDVYNKLNYIAKMFFQLTKRYAGKNKDNLTKARRTNFSKYKKIFIDKALILLRENNVNDETLDLAYKSIFLI